MKLLNEKEFNYYKDNPGYLKFRLAEIREAIKQCDFFINNEDQIYTLSKFTEVYQIKQYKEYLICELKTIKVVKKFLERGYDYE